MPVFCEDMKYFQSDYFSARFRVQCLATMLFLAGGKTSEIAIGAPWDTKLSN